MTRLCPGEMAGIKGKRRPSGSAAGERDGFGSGGAAGRGARVEAATDTGAVGAASAAAAVGVSGSRGRFRRGQSGGASVCFDGELR